MTTRTARCACGRVEVTVEGEPLMVYVCHCEFCQRRSGNVFIASAQFAEEQVVSITGDTTRYNGLEVDGVGAVAIEEGINYHFCSVCGSSLYHQNVMPATGQRIYAVRSGPSRTRCSQLRPSSSSRSTGTAGWQLCRTPSSSLTRSARMPTRHFGWLTVGPARR